jgi:hypothetical protein
MYPKNETDQSFEYLKKVVHILDEPICILGGWAIYLTVNKAYKSQLNKNYLGSRDVDLGFHLDKKSSFENSTLTKAIKKLEAEGFMEVGGRMLKQLDWETGKELTSEEAIKKAQFEINPMYVDLLADYLPKNLKKETKMDIFDEPLLSLVFEDKNNRTELKEFGRKLWLPKSWLLLATKIKAVPNRQKDHKRQKDICDIAALLLFEKSLQNKQGQASLLKAVQKHEILESLEGIKEQEISKTEEILEISKNSFKAALSKFLEEIQTAKPGNAKKKQLN